MKNTEETQLVLKIGQVTLVNLSWSGIWLQNGYQLFPIKGSMFRWVDSLSITAFVSYYSNNWMFSHLLHADYAPLSIFERQSIFL